MDDHPFHSWDDDAMGDELMARLPLAKRERLRTAQLPSTPGVYALFVVSSRPEVVDAVGPISARGEYPVYCGVATGTLRERLRRYRQTLSDVDSLDLDDVWVSTLTCASAASAHFCEDVLHERLPTVFARIGGFGCKIPGKNRRNQRVSAFDALLPGRNWVSPATEIDRARAQLAVLAFLAGELLPGGLRWPPLLGAGPDVSTARQKDR